MLNSRIGGAGAAEKSGGGIVRIAMKAHLVLTVYTAVV